MTIGFVVCWSRRSLPQLICELTRVCFTCFQPVTVTKLIKSHFCDCPSIHWGSECCGVSSLNQPSGKVHIANSVVEWRQFNCCCCVDFLLNCFVKGLRNTIYIYFCAECDKFIFWKIRECVTELIVKSTRRQSDYILLFEGIISRGEERKSVACVIPRKVSVPVHYIVFIPIQILSLGCFCCCCCCWHRSSESL